MELPPYLSVLTILTLILFASVPYLSSESRKKERINYKIQRHALAKAVVGTKANKTGRKSIEDKTSQELQSSRAYFHKTNRPITLPIQLNQLSELDVLELFREARYFRR